MTKCHQSPPLGCSIKTCMVKEGHVAVMDGYFKFLFCYCTHSCFLNVIKGGYFIFENAFSEQHVSSTYFLKQHKSNIFLVTIQSSR